MGLESQTGGVKPMAIAGRFDLERERLLGMTEAERAYRKQWLKDQHLAPNEPRVVPEIYKATTNPIRRFYRWPLDQLEKKLTPSMGLMSAKFTRHVIAKSSFAIMAIYATYYNFKYHSNEWDRKTGWTVKASRPACYPGDPEYPKVSDRTKPADYSSKGFDKVTLNL
ncbi:hypothetical protein ABEB36_013463 [Hypothenemus hampei]|uniref:NADH dehydrogenase [ubiquinone] 1 beta subcomplex subunit 6 n=1 Tax=Hypothenemus hampei TaxID=57062 RepID=A0ABD1E846_HYPHA